MGSLHVRLDPTAKFDTVYFRHHNIADNQVRIFLYRFSLSFLAVCRFNDLIEIFQLFFQESTELLIVLH